MNAAPVPTLFQICVMALLQAICAVLFVFVIVPLTIYAERKVLGHVQDRLGATRIAGHRVGLTGWLNRGMWRMGKVPFLSYWRGLPMLVGDIAKLFLKEDIVPDKADRAMFLVAPAISLAAAVVVFKNHLRNWNCSLWSTYLKGTLTPSGNIAIEASRQIFNLHASSNKRSPHALVRSRHGPRSCAVLWLSGQGDARAAPCFRDFHLETDERLCHVRVAARSSD